LQPSDYLVLKDISSKLEDTVVTCKRDRLRYLEKTTLLAEIESVLDDFAFCRDKPSREKACFEASVMTCHPDVYTHLQKSYAV